LSSVNTTVTGCCSLAYACAYYICVILNVKREGQYIGLRSIHDKGHVKMNSGAGVGRPSHNIEKFWRKTNEKNRKFSCKSVHFRAF